MLARENRLRSAEDFRSTMRSGKKAVGNCLVIYLKPNHGSGSPRFGFVVSKAVGSAVQRNLVKRRLRSAIRERLVDFNPGDSIVIRALPASAKATWEILNQDLERCLNNVKA